MGGLLGRQQSIGCDERTYNQTVDFPRLWRECTSSVWRVLDSSGANLAGARIRHLWGATWLYHESEGSFEIVRVDDFSALRVELVPPEPVEVDDDEDFVGPAVAAYSLRLQATPSGGVLLQVIFDEEGHLMDQYSLPKEALGALPNAIDAVRRELITYQSFRADQERKAT